MLEVKIHSLSVDAVSNQPVIILREPESGKLLPIWIGQNEATAILLRLQGVEPPRPLTHDLLRNILEDLGYEVSKVEITRLAEGTFFAQLVLDREGQTMMVDARPSDSIALAVRTGSPLYVAEEVLEEAGLEPEVDEEEEVERFRAFLEEITPEDFVPPS